MVNAFVVYTLCVEENTRRHINISRNIDPNGCIKETAIHVKKPLAEDNGIVSSCTFWILCQINFPFFDFYTAFTQGDDDWNLQKDQLKRSKLGKNFWEKNAIEISQQKQKK